MNLIWWKVNVKISQFKKSFIRILWSWKMLFIQWLVLIEITGEKEMYKKKDLYTYVERFYFETINYVIVTWNDVRTLLDFYGIQHKMSKTLIVRIFFEKK